MTKIKMNLSTTWKYENYLMQPWLKKKKKERKKTDTPECIQNNN